ncbi:MAG: formyltransferase family protein [Candidatus Anammoxibacter sp.]
MMIITIVSDADSWINNYITPLVEKLKNNRHLLRWFHKVSDIQEGDLVFYLGCEQIVPKEILNRNRHNLVVHESALPEGKGWSPLTWQILEGKNEIPITLFEAVEKVDSGVIYLQDVMHFKGDELIDELRKIQAEKTNELILKFINDYPKIVKKGVEQCGKDSFYRKRTSKDSRLDPDKTIKEQFDLLRTVDNKRYPAFFEMYGETYLLEIKK